MIGLGVFTCAAFTVWLLARRQQQTGERPLSPYATIVVGASSGGLETLQTLVAGLPADIPASIFIVQHIGRFMSSLPTMLGKVALLPVRYAIHLQLIEPRRVYVAPPDHHLMLARGHMRLSRGPRENWARPAVDPLFRSAGESFDGRTIGVILSGVLNDGSAGLHTLRRLGGKAVVQDPRDAAFAEMPASALRHAGADYCLPIKDIAPLLVKMTHAMTTQSGEDHSDSWRIAP